MFDAVKNRSINFKNNLVTIEGLNTSIFASPKSSPKERT